MDSEVIRRIAVDHPCPNLFPQRVLHVVELQFEIMLQKSSDDEIGVLRIRYTITPLLRSISWRWSGVDDVGTTYMDCGGAYGPSKDNRATNGVLSLQPLPPVNATSITITLSPSFDLGLTHRECSFTVDLASP